MSLRQLICIMGAGFVLLGSGTVFGQGAAPVAKPATLWSFLGIPQAYTSARDNMSNRNGNRPRAERKPPLTRLADPENLKSENPAIKRAAEIKKEEDLAKQKIKAVKYLTKIGCGCYNRDGSITDALLKALDDCTEDVRLATVEAIAEAANGEACVNCKNKSCCSEEISNKLYEMAYERDDAGCFLEPSERVREAAAEALRACCPGRGSEEGYIIDETPAGEPGTIPGGEGTPMVVPPGGELPRTVPPDPQPIPGTPVPPPVPGPGPELGPTPAAPPAPVPSPASGDETGFMPPPGQKSSRRTAAIYGGVPTVTQASGQMERTSPPVAFASETIENTPAPAVEPAPAVIDPSASEPAPSVMATPAPQRRPAPQASVNEIGQALTTSVDQRNNQAMINLPGGETVRVGTVLRGFHSYAFTGKQPVGDFVVVQSTPGFAIVRPVGLNKVNKLSAGDELLVVQQ